MAKNACKREKKSPAEKTIDDLRKQLVTFNAVHGTDFYIASAADVELELRSKAAMTFAFSEQFAMDKVQIVLNRDFEFGESRMKKLQQGYLTVSDYFSALEKENGNDDLGVAHTTHEFETVLQQATKSLYVERDKRYAINITYNGKRLEDVKIKDWSKD